MRYSLSVLSGVLLGLASANTGLSFLAWFALVPLLAALEDAKPLKSFLMGWSAGIAFFLISIYWLIHVTLPGMVIVVMYLALYFGLFAIYYSSVVCRAPFVSRIILIPAGLVAVEFFRSHLFAGFGWALLAHTQTSLLPVIQIADVTGACGVTFIVALVNGCIVMTAKEIKLGQRHFKSLIVTILILFISISYGVYRLKNIFIGETLKVAVLQGNIPQSQKWDERFREDILTKYENLSREAAKEYPDLIIWPETSIPGCVGLERGLSERVVSLAETIKIPILAGAPRMDSSDRFYNSAFLFSEDGRIADRYDKMHLVPFGEYIPFRRLLSFVENFAPSPIGDFSAGVKPTVFNIIIERRSSTEGSRWKIIRKAAFSCMICFEDIFPEIARTFARSGASFLVNVTNDAWFGDTVAPYQHAASSVFRGVENRINVVRAANTGVSCFIDQKGQILKAVSKGGKETFVEGFAVCDITLAGTRTFYTLYGDIFAYICLVISAAAFVINLVAGRLAKR